MLPMIYSSALSTCAAECAGRKDQHHYLHPEYIQKWQSLSVSIIRSSIREKATSLQIDMTFKQEVRI